MKTLNMPLKFFMGLFFILLFCGSANAQFLKKLGKKAQEAAERTIERRVEEESSKKTDKALDSILEPGSKQKQPQAPSPTSGESNTPTPTSQSGNGNSGESNTNTSNEPKSLTVYSKFDFVPGDKPLFFDDFSADFIGDFPSKWNTNAGGEVVTLGESSEKWFELKSGYNLFFIPNVPQLPEDYTIEFDVEAVGLSRQTSSTAHLRVDLSDNYKFSEGANFAQAHIPFCQYSPIGITVENRKNNKREIYSTIKADIRNEVLNRPHISIAVNKERYRIWVNEVKYADVPKMVPSGGILHTLKFHMNNFKDGVERIFITNLKIAEGGVDLRRKLIAEGKISTNGILFDSGSANIKPESMGIIRQIYQVLEQDNSINLKIVGHTDSDGGDDVNMKLSKSRAEAVKNALIQVYAVSANRLQAEGKGESEPVAENDTPDGKAQNRRVEFIKI